MIAAIYSRKSKFTESGDSIENQVQLCKQYAENLGIDRVIVYEDEGFSGGTTDRPQFKKMMKDASLKKFDVLICYRLDRVSRNIADFSNLINSLQDLNIGFASIREQFDTSTPMGRAMMYIASIFAQLERETIAQRVQDNMLELAKTGRWLGGQAPLGFESKSMSYIDNEYKERKLYILSPIKEELDIVKQIYDKYLELKSLSKVYKYLLANKIKTKQDSNWSKSTIQGILTNPVYVKADESIFLFLNNLGISTAGKPDGIHGLLTYNKKKGKYIYRDVSEWIAAVSNHDGIIDSNHWLSVQELLKSNKSKAPMLGKTNTALLTGLLKCAECGSNMRISYGKPNKNTGEKNFYYQCSMKVDSGGARCSNKNVNGRDIERIVINELKKVFTNEDNLIQKLKALKNSAELSDTLEIELKAIKKEIEEAEDSIKNLVKQLSKSSDLNIEKYILSEIDSLTKSKKGLELELKILEDKKTSKRMNDNNIDIVLQALKNFNTLIDVEPFEMKKILLNTVVDSIYWNGATGEVDIKLWGIEKKKLK